MTRILKYVMLDIIKSKLVVVYAILFALLSWSLFSLEDNSAKAVLSLTNVVLLVVPLVTVIFSTIYMYNASEFIELLASQPLKRSSIWIGFFWDFHLRWQWHCCSVWACPCCYLPIFLWQWSCSLQG